MSGQWEVVGRKNKDKLAINNKKNGKQEQKLNPTKVEDVLPSSQIKSLYVTNGKSNKENKKPQEKKENKENVKKQTTKKPEKSQDSPKIKPHKSIESALNTIQANDLKVALDANIEKYPNAPLIWLKDLASILNTKLNVELNDPVFSNKPDNYPLSAIPANIKQIIEKTVERAGKSNAQLFYDITLTAMVTDMSKGHPALGHKILLQLLGHNNPHISVANLEKHHDLRTSYQNRQPVCLSLLWAIGQGGVKDFNIGLKAFRDFMLPLLEMRNYSKYVVQYLVQLLKRHENVTLSKENFIFLFDLSHKKHSLPNEQTQQLLGINKTLKNMVLSKSKDKKYTSLFEPLFLKLVDSATNSTKNDIAAILISLLSSDVNCYSTWVQLYMKNLQQSSILLKYISEHWKKTSSQLDIKRLRDTVKTFVATNSELSKNTKKDPALNDTIAVCKILLDKMTASKSFPWKTLIFLIFLGAGTFLFYDIKKHGDWQKSQSVRTLKEMGVWEYGEKTWDKAHQGLNWTRQRIEEYAPGYIDSAHQMVQPYVELTKDLGLVIYNLGETYTVLITEKYPVVIEYYNTYVPVMIETIQNKTIIAAEKSKEYAVQGYEYLTTQVFVGEMSPENMQKTFWKGLTTAQNYVMDGYHWVYDKIETTINGK